MLDLTVEKTALSPGDASICNKNVKTAVELFYDFIDKVLDVFLASDIYLVSSA